MGGTYQEFDKPALGLREDVENRVHQAAELTQRFNDRLALGVANLAERHRRGEVEVTFSSASSQISGWSGQNIVKPPLIKEITLRSVGLPLKLKVRLRLLPDAVGIAFDESSDFRVEDVDLSVRPI